MFSSNFCNSLGNFLSAICFCRSAKAQDTESENADDIVYISYPQQQRNQTGNPERKFSTLSRLDSQNARKKAKFYSIPCMTKSFGQPAEKYGLPVPEEVFACGCSKCQIYVLSSIMQDFGEDIYQQPYRRRSTSTSYEEVDSLSSLEYVATFSSTEDVVTLNSYEDPTTSARNGESTQAKCSHGLMDCCEFNSRALSMIIHDIDEYIKNQQSVSDFTLSQDPIASTSDGEPIEKEERRMSTQDNGTEATAAEAETGKQNMASTAKTMKW